MIAPAGAQRGATTSPTTLRWVDPDELDPYDPDEGLVRLIRVGLAVARRLGAAPTT